MAAADYFVISRDLSEQRSPELLPSHAVTLGVAAATCAYFPQTFTRDRPIGRIEHTHQAIKSLDDVLSAAQNVETGTR